MAQQLRVNPETQQIETLLPTGEWSASAFEEQNKELLTSTLDTSVITSETLAHGEETPFIEPTAPTTPSLPVIDETLFAPTPKEKGISDLIGELGATTGLPAEKEAFRIEQEKEAGISELQKSEADYTAQLKQLEADFKNVQNRMQLQAEGRGITAGGLAPLTMAEQRKISIQANTVSALLAATQGKITFAQSQVAKAVNDKYAVREAERKVKLENLELLSKDPTLTLEQQKRAAEQKAALDQQEKSDTKKKDDSKTIMRWAVDAAKNGATPEQAQAISEIGLSDNPDLQKAMGLYAPFAAKKEVDRVLSPAEAKTLGVPYGTTEKQAIAMGITPKGGEVPTEINQKLFNVGLSPTAVSNTGKITDSNIGKLGSAGIPPDTAQGIMDEILKGTTLEELRQWFRSKGVEMINGKAIMDIFMETIQGVSSKETTGEKIPVNPFKKKP